MNLLLLMVPPLHSAVLEPDLHLKQQENGDAFQLNLCSVLIFSHTINLDLGMAMPVCLYHHFGPTTVWSSNVHGAQRKNPTDFTSSATSSSKLSRIL